MLREWIDILRQRLTALVGPYARQIAQRIDPYVGQARSRYQKLEPREQLLVRVAAGIVGLFLAYNLIYLPIVNLESGLRDRIAQRDADLSQVRRLVSAYAELKTDLKSAEHNTVPKAKDFSLFSVLETSLTGTVGRDKIGSITPGTDRQLPDGFTEYSVQLKLANVNLAQVVNALYGINTLAQPVGVEGLRIQRRSQDPHAFDVDMTCVALAKNG